MELSKKTIEKDFIFEKMAVLTVRLNYPAAVGLSVSARRISRFYERFAARMLRYAKATLYPEAKRRLKALNQGKPFAPFAFTMDYTVARNDGEFVSLYCDIVTRFGLGTATERYADTFSAQSGFLLKLSELFPAKTHYRKLILQALLQQAAGRQEAGELYLDHPKRRLKRHFSEEQFYLTDQGLAVFYQLYTVAPLSRGIPVFQLNSLPLVSRSPALRKTGERENPAPVA